MFCMPLASATLEPYVDQFFPGLRPNIWQLQALGDVMLIASYFVLGGDFWSKVRALFVRTAKVEDASARSTPHCLLSTTSSARAAVPTGQSVSSAAPVSALMTLVTGNQ